ncbi:MAG: PAS domain-containing protein [Chloroflexi bacterium]|nr:PAS domain-containing protein [Chloroflexota bacterium]
MNWNWSAPMWLLLAAMALTLGSLRATWPCRRAPGARTLLALLAAGTLWSLLGLIQLGARQLPTRLFWDTLAYGVAGLAAAFWFQHVLQVTDLRRRLSPAEFLSLLALPALAVLLGLAWPLGGPLRREAALFTAGGSTWLQQRYGLLFWAMSLFLQGLTIAGSLLLLRRATRQRPRDARQSRLIALVALLPVLASLVYVYTDRASLPMLDPTPVALALASLAPVIALRRTALFDLASAGREAAVAAMREGWLVIDEADRIVALNAAARDILARSGMVSARTADLTGRRMNMLAPALSPMVRQQMDPAAQAQPITVGRGSVARHYRATLTPVRNRYDEPSGTVLMLEDVTSPVAVERQSHQLAEEMERMTARVDALIALLPRCGSCGQLIVDEAYRARLQAFLDTHPQVAARLAPCEACAHESQTQSPAP